MKPDNELSANELINILKTAITAQVYAGFLVEKHALVGALQVFKDEIATEIISIHMNQGRK